MRPDADGNLPPHQRNCFGCGPDNAAGLHLQMRVEDEHVLADTTFDHRFEGAPGIVHGGAVAAALDDLFGGVLVMLQRPAVTARLTVDYHAPAFLHRRLRLDGWLHARHGRKLEMHATLHDDATHVATATSLFMTVDITHFAQAGVPIPDTWRAWAAMADATDL